MIKKIVGNIIGWILLVGVILAIGSYILWLFEPPEFDRSYDSYYELDYDLPM